MKRVIFIMVLIVGLITQCLTLSYCKNENHSVIALYLSAFIYGSLVSFMLFKEQIKKQTTDHVITVETELQRDLKQILDKITIQDVLESQGVREVHGNIIDSIRILKDEF